MDDFIDAGDLALRLQERGFDDPVRAMTPHGSHTFAITDLTATPENGVVLHLHETERREHVKGADEESNLVQHARFELAHLLTHDDPDERGVAEAVLAAVQGFMSYEGHSGGSHAVAVHWLTELLNFRALGPLTNDPAEWVDVAEYAPGQPLWQNRRHGEAFSHDGGKTYYLLADDRWEGEGEDRHLVRDAHARTSVARA